MTSSLKYPGPLLPGMARAVAVISCAAESQLQCCLARHSRSLWCSTQQPPSSPTERKYQRVLLKQCGFNLRGVRAFKTATQSLPRPFRSVFFFPSSFSLEALYKKILSLLRFSQQKIVQKPLFHHSFPLCSSVFDHLPTCLFGSFSSRHTTVANGLLHSVEER